MNGLGLGFCSLTAGRPAMTGSIKYGPKRFSYSVDETRWQNVSGAISRSSFIRYMLTRKRIDSWLGAREGQGTTRASAQGRAA